MLHNFMDNKAKKTNEKVFYRLEFVLGLIILGFGFLFLILFIVGGVILTIGTLIPIIFLITGVYLLYEAVTEVDLNPENY